MGLKSTRNSAKEGTPFIPHTSGSSGSQPVPVHFAPPQPSLASWEGLPGGSVGKESACNAGDPVRFLGPEDPLEQEMTTHSSILAWSIPWTEEPGGLQSMMSQRVRSD